MRLDKEFGDIVYKALQQDDVITQWMRKAGVTAEFVANWAEGNLFEGYILQQMINEAAEVKQFCCHKCHTWANLDEMAWVVITESREEYRLLDGICHKCFQKDHPGRSAGVCLITDTAV